MNQNLELIQKFKGKLIGTKRTKRLITQALLLLPTDIINYLTKNCWFLSSTEDAWAYTFNGNDVINKHFIFLSDELLAQDKAQITYTILHEVGHIILGHKNSIGEKQTKSEIRKQEKEADQFAKMFLNENSY